MGVGGDTGGWSQGVKVGGVPPLRGWVQVPEATQEVRLGPWKVEALGCEDQGVAWPAEPLTQKKQLWDT